MLDIIIHSHGITVEFLRRAEWVGSDIWDGRPGLMVAKGSKPPAPGLERHGGADASVIECFDGDFVEFSASVRSQDELVSAAIGDGTRLVELSPNQQGHYYFTPPSYGLHEIALSLASGWSARLRVVRLKSEWLNRMTIGGVFSRAEFMSRAHGIARAILRENQAMVTSPTFDGSFNEEINLGPYGAAGPGFTLGRFTA